MMRKHHTGGIDNHESLERRASQRSFSSDLALVAGLCLPETPSAV
jgi:hypothetical protein